MEDMFTDSVLSPTQYSNALVNWKIIADDNGISNITLGAGGINFITSVADASRGYLINDLNWSITDAGGI